jgi:hypothetical protein
LVWVVREALRAIAAEETADGVRAARNHLKP